MKQKIDTFILSNDIPLSLLNYLKVNLQSMPRIEISWGCSSLKASVSKEEPYLVIPVLKFPNDWARWLSFWKEVLDILPAPSLFGLMPLFILEQGNLEKWHLPFLSFLEESSLYAIPLSFCFVDTNDFQKSTFALWSQVMRAFGELENLKEIERIHEQITKIQSEVDYILKKH